MTTKRKFKSDAFEAIHSSASALLEVGAIDKTTMRRSKCKNQAVVGCS